MADRANETQPAAVAAAVPDEQQPDRDGFVLIHHVGTKAESRVKPRSVATWETRGWKPGPLSPQARSAAERQGVTPNTAG